MSATGEFLSNAKDKVTSMLPAAIPGVGLLKIAYDWFSKDKADVVITDLKEYASSAINTTASALEAGKQ